MRNLLLAIVVVGCIAGGLWWSGIIGPSAAPEAPVQVPLQPAMAQAPMVPAQAPAAPQEPDPRLVRQRAERIAAAERGVDVISRDLADRQGQIAKAEAWLADIQKRKVVEAAQLKVRQATAGSTAQDSANVSLRNLIATIQERQQELARDREVAASLAKRLATAEEALKKAIAVP